MANPLAYLALSSVTKEKSFITLRPAEPETKGDDNDEAEIEAYAEKSVSGNGNGNVGAKPGVNVIKLFSFVTDDEA